MFYRSDTTTSYTHYDDASFLLKYRDAYKENHKLYLIILDELDIFFENFYSNIYSKKFKLFGHMTYVKMCREMFGRSSPAINNWACSGSVHWMNKQGFPKDFNDKLRNILTSPRWVDYDLEKLLEQIEHSASNGFKMSVCTNDFRRMECALNLTEHYKKLIVDIKELQGVVDNAAQNMDANSKNNS